MTIGILGLGSIGMRHAQNAIDLGEKVIAFDPDAERQSVVEAIGGCYVSSEGELWGNIDAVVIASPNKYHKQNLLTALEKKCHVLVEKPLSHTSEGVEGAIARAASSGIIVAAGMNLRFNDVISATHAILNSGTYGRILWGRFIASTFLPDWRPQQDYRQGYTTESGYGGVIFDYIHEFDLAQHLLGLAKTRSCVAWQSGVLETEAEDSAEIVLEHEGGIHSSIHLDYVSQNTKRYFEIQMDKGLLKTDIFKRTIEIHDKDDNLAHFETVPGAFGDAYVSEMKAFIAAVREGKEFPCTGIEACHILKTVLDARAMADLPAAT